MYPYKSVNKTIYFMFNTNVYRVYIFGIIALTILLIYKYFRKMQYILIICLVIFKINNNNNRYEQKFWNSFKV